MSRVKEIIAASLAATSFGASAQGFAPANDGYKAPTDQVIFDKRFQDAIGQILMAITNDKKPSTEACETAIRLNGKQQRIVENPGGGNILVITGSSLAAIPTEEGIKHFSYISKTPLAKITPEEVMANAAKAVKSFNAASSESRNSSFSSAEDTKRALTSKLAR